MENPRKPSGDWRPTRRKSVGVQRRLIRKRRMSVHSPTNNQMQRREGMRHIILLGLSSSHQDLIATSPKVMGWLAS